jgi:hypothetical protein
MPESNDRDSRRRNIVWEEGTMVCASYMFAPDDFEITVTLNGVEVQRERFSDTQDAMRFIIDKMHVSAAL